MTDAPPKLQLVTHFHKKQLQVIQQLKATENKLIFKEFKFIFHLYFKPL